MGYPRILTGVPHRVFSKLWDGPRMASSSRCSPKTCAEEESLLFASTVISEYTVCRDDMLHEVCVIEAGRKPPRPYCYPTLRSTHAVCSDGHGINAQCAYARPLMSLVDHEVVSPRPVVSKTPP